MLTVLSKVRPGWVVLTTALLVAVPIQAAPIEEKPVEKGELTAPEKLRKELDRAITIEISEQSLSMAINQLKDQTRVNLVVDRTMLNQMGLDPDSIPVSVNLKDARLQTVLRTILRPQNLSFAIIGDTVLISTDDMCMHRQMKQRIRVDLEGTELSTALKRLARETGTNVLFDPKVVKEAATPLTMQLEDVPYETAVKLMTEMAGLKAVRVGNVLFICSKQQANEMRQDPDFAPNPNGPVPPGIDFPPGGFNPPGIGMGGIQRGFVVPNVVPGVAGPGGEVVPDLPPPPPPAAPAPEPDR